MISVVDWNSRHQSAYCCCLGDHDECLRSGARLKRYWIQKMSLNGLECKIAIDEYKQPIGMIEYVPMRVAPAEGDGYYFINCIHVIGPKHPRGTFRNRGVGKALLKVCEDDAVEHGAKGVAAWGWIRAPGMKASWFEKQGYKFADRKGHKELLRKKFARDAERPRWIAKKPSPMLDPDIFTITAYISGQCPIMNYRFSQLRKISAEFGGLIQFNCKPTMTKESMLQYGTNDAIFVGKKLLNDCTVQSDNSVRIMLKKALKNFYSPSFLRKYLKL